MRVAEVVIGKMKKWEKCRVNGTEVKFRQKVLVEGDRSIELGEVLRPCIEVDDEEVENYPRILRPLLPHDFFRIKKLEQKAKESLVVCQEWLNELGLPMKLVEAEFSADGSKLYIYFYSEERVDFRELVRRLAGKYRRRIELVQTTPREVTRLCGGAGPCGKPLCCSFSPQFPYVTREMVQLQFLPAGSAKILGACGQIKCCIRYELEPYEMRKEILPAMGSKVFTARGEGLVVGVDVYSEKAVVKLSDGKIETFAFSEISRTSGCSACSLRNGNEKD